MKNINMFNFTKYTILSIAYKTIVYKMYGYSRRATITHNAAIN